MPTSKEQLLQMLKAIINDNETEAAEIHHNYITTKTAEIAGFKQPEPVVPTEHQPEPESTEDEEHNFSTQGYND